MQKLTLSVALKFLFSWRSFIYGGIDSLLYRSVCKSQNKISKIHHGKTITRLGSGADVLCFCCWCCCYSVCVMSRLYVLITSDDRYFSKFPICNDFWFLFVAFLLIFICKPKFVYSNTFTASILRNVYVQLIVCWTAENFPSFSIAESWISSWVLCG